MNPELTVLNLNSPGKVLNREYKLGCRAARLTVSFDPHFEVGQIKTLEMKTGEWFIL